MGHIANLMLQASSYEEVANCLSQALPSLEKIKTNNFLKIDEMSCQDTQYKWRMNESNEATLSSNNSNSASPGKNLQGNAGKCKEIEELPPKSPSRSLFLSKTPSTDIDRPATTLGVSLKMKLNEPILTRRRKISVPELGPMTTVQEVAMDSPTIPGRPPVHERSHSVPVNTCRQRLGENSSSLLSGPVPDEEAEIAELSNTNEELNDSLSPLTEPVSSSCVMESPTHSPQLVSPLASHLKQCQPTEQSNHSLSALLQKSSKVSTKTSTQPPEVPPKSPKIVQETSSSTPKISPFIPISAWSSAISATFSAYTPSSSPLSEGRSSPRLWNFGRSSPMAWGITGRSSPKIFPHSKTESSPTSSTLSLKLHQHKSEVSLNSETSKTSSVRSHGRHSSEDGSSSKSDDRGRTKQRSRNDISPRNNQDSKSPPDQVNSSNEDSSSAPNVACYLPEQQSFLSLPEGYPPNSACQIFSQAEIYHLYHQALSQAFRFQVLSSRDVDSLSRELRALDERCEYLRKTHHSHRNDRQSLYARICNYLRNPRMACFSHEALLKRVETLSDLDRSIDACVSKLEQAENRRMRVRQKLLEHVAAAAILEIKPPGDESLQSNIRSSPDATGENTPPRSPQHSPERLTHLVKTVPSHSKLSSTTPESPLVNTSNSPKNLSEKNPEHSPGVPLEQDSPSQNNSEDFSSQSQQNILIYAENDLFALMDCVEEEMQRMGM